MSILRAELATAEAIARHEMGDRDAALFELRAIADSADEFVFYCSVAAMLALAAAAADDGDAAAAAVELARAEAVLDSTSRSADLGGWVLRTATGVALAGGNVEEARRNAAACTDEFWGPACRARVGAGDRRPCRRRRDARDGAAAVRSPRGRARPAQRPNADRAG